MKDLIVYTSMPSSGQMTTFLRAVGEAHHVDVRPISALPAPDEHRRQQLRVVRLELLDAVAETQRDLGCFERGEVQPDAGRENGLRYDLEAYNRRLAGINTVLGTEIGGPDNG
ncbi:MAG TPA: hypothetical protein VF630_09005 [Hymenobacter sp.]|jgi:hypothetical protein